MPSSRIRCNAGLWTDPSALDTPEGALLVAEDVLLHRAGVIQPRIGLGSNDGIGARGLLPADGAVSVRLFDPPDEYPLTVSTAGHTHVSFAPVLRDALEVATQTQMVVWTVTFSPVTGYTITASEAFELVFPILTPEGQHLMSVLGIESEEVGGGTEWSSDVAVSGATWRPIAIVPYRGDLIVQSRTPDDDYVLESAETGLLYSAWTLPGGGPTPPDTDIRGRSSFFEARGSLYLTSTHGIRKLSAPHAEELIEAGVWQTYQQTARSEDASAASSVSEAAILPNASVGYRWLVRRTDENGYVIRGAPGSRVVAGAEPTAMPDGATLMHTWWLPPQARPGDVIELYRTRSSGHYEADPGEDYYLAATIELTDSHIIDGWIEYTDTVLDEMLGAALYTSASQFGALASKEIPPLPIHLAWWNGCAWAGNTLERGAQTAWLQKVAASDGEFAGIGLALVESVTASGNDGATLTGVAFGEMGFDALAAGMRVTNHSGAFSDPTYVISWDAGEDEITLSEAPITAPPFGFALADTVTIDGVEFVAQSVGGTIDPNSRGFGLESTPSVSAEDRAYLTARDLARLISVVGVGPDLDVYSPKDQSPVGGSGEILLLSSKAGGPAPTFSTNRPSAFAFTPTTEDVRKGGRLHWSAPDEPEAWPPAQSTMVGRPEADILALTPLRDALLVWKTDGLYRVSGSPPSSWVVDRVDTTVRLLAPDAVCVIDDVAFAWTDRGVVRVTEGGVAEIVSAPIANQLRDMQRAYPAEKAEHKRAVWMVPHRRLGLAILSVAEEPTDEVSLRWYVLHTTTGAWSTWEREDRIAAYDPAHDRLVTAPGVDAWELRYESGDDETAPLAYVDVMRDVSAQLDDGRIVVPQADFGPWTPKVGDALFIASEAQLLTITEIEPWETFYIFAVPPTTFVGPITAALWIQGIHSRVRWHAQHLPGIGARWQEIHVQLLSGANLNPFSWPLLVGGARGDQEDAVQVEARVPSVVTSYPVRTGIPRELARATHLYPQVDVQVPLVLWRLSELNLHFSATSRRASR